MNKTTTNLNQNNTFLDKENKQTNQHFLHKIFSSLAQTAQQFGETADRTAEQLCLETLFLLDIV